MGTNREFLFYGVSLAAALFFHCTPSRVFSGESVAASPSGGTVAFQRISYQAERSNLDTYSRRRGYYGRRPYARRYYGWPYSYNDYYYYRSYPRYHSYYRPYYYRPYRFYGYRSFPRYYGRYGFGYSSPYYYNYGYGPSFGGGFGYGYCF